MQNRTNDIVIFLVGCTLLILVLISFIITILYVYRKKQAAFIQSLEDMKLSHDKILLSTQVEIQESTFKHISREIHDNITLELTLAKLKLHTVRLNNTVEAENLINETLVILSNSITDLSDISKSLDSDIITTNGLINALEAEIQKLKGIKSLKVEMTVTGDTIYMEVQKELVIFRIVQESFNNIIKHAFASRVELHLHYNTNHIDITIADNGVGFTAAPDDLTGKAGAGLKNITARAAMFDGTAVFNTAPGMGTKVEVRIPYSGDDGKIEMAQRRKATAGAKEEPVSSELVEKVDDVSAGGE